jgi:broad specificity phosphatase PhoE
MGRIILVRHTAVAAHWKGRCYGRSDAGLSRDGREQARAIAGALAAFAPDVIISSPLRRARFLAHLIAREHGDVDVRHDDRLRECFFGAWEGRSWDDIYRETGDAMMGLVQEPETFRPGGDGETTFDLRDRAMAWLGSVAGNKTVLAVCHGGPIAAIRGTLENAPVDRWPSLIPQTGTWVEFGS